MIKEFGLISPVMLLTRNRVLQNVNDTYYIDVVLSLAPRRNQCIIVFFSPVSQMIYVQSAYPYVHLNSQSLLGIQQSVLSILLVFLTSRSRTPRLFCRKSIQTNFSLKHNAVRNTIHTHTYV